MQQNFLNKYVINAHFWLILIIDIALFSAAYYLSWELRFETISRQQMVMLKTTLPVVVGTKLLMFFLIHLYSGLWRYSGPRDLVKIVLACGASTVLIITFFTLQHRFQHYSRSIFLIDSLLTVFFISGFRLAIKTYYLPDQLRYIFRFRDLFARNRRRLLIVGAGTHGENLLRSIFEHHSLSQQYFPIGFLDDQPGKRGMKIHGIPIKGTVDTLPDIVEKEEIQEIMIALATADAATMRHIVGLCQETGVPFKIVPTIEEIVLNEGKSSPIRELSYEDLLGRDPVTVDYDVVREQVAGKVVLVTGAGGSIGSELCRQVCRYSPRLILLFDISEYGLYRIEMSLKSLFPDVPVVSVIGSVEDRSVVEPIMRQYTPHFVFHTAAYKHVPVVEMNPVQGVKNNVFGTATMVRMAERYGVNRFVFISTDKAVRPTSLMGATKRVGELITLSHSTRSKTRFMIVRFGNVVGSGGSVVPLFMDQIRQGGPVTVTHPEVTRFFMSIQEAVLLVLQAASMGEGGEAFLLDMGRPVKILNMAEDLIRLAGKEPYQEIDIVFTGLRPGEKLYEELLVDGETSLPTRHQKIYTAKAGSMDWKELESTLMHLRNCVDERNLPEILETIRALIPDYHPSDFLGGKTEKKEPPRLRVIS